MDIIVITQPHAVDSEPELILAALSAGACRVHIRKPEWSEAQLAALLEALPLSAMERITIHDHFELCDRFGVGAHINGRNPKAPDCCTPKSRSCHSLEEIKESQEFDYMTLSPIYDSISKQQYCSNFTHDELLNGGISRKVVALGGVTPQHIPQLYGLGFGGAALMGYVWQDESVEGVADRVGEAVKMARMCRNFSLQYITHSNATKGYVEGAQAALDGGCRWVQLRQKGASEAEFISSGEAIREACHSAGAIFLLNDRVELVAKLGADGVHLGREDMSPAQAREILGRGAIIGGTANTCEDIDRLVAQGVDYIGFGPLRFTTTKQKLSSVLGVEGYKRAIQHIRQSGYTTPIVAIGGVVCSDIEPLLRVGAMGVAVSGEILNAEDSVSKTEEFTEILNSVEL